MIRKRFPRLDLFMGPTTLRDHCSKGSMDFTMSTNLGGLSLDAFFFKITQSFKRLEVSQRKCGYQACNLMILYSLRPLVCPSCWWHYMVMSPWWVVGMYLKRRPSSNIQQTLSPLMKNLVLSIFRWSIVEDFNPLYWVAWSRRYSMAQLVPPFWSQRLIHHTDVKAHLR